MTWIKLEDTWPMHPKVQSVEPASRLLYIVAICHCSQHLTDGDIAPSSMPLLLFSAGADQAHADELVTAGLFDLTESGYRVHNYTERQRSKSSVQEQRVKDRERKARSRAKKSQESQQESRRDTPSDSARSPRVEEKREEQIRKEENPPPFKTAHKAPARDDTGGGGFTEWEVLEIWNKWATVTNQALPPEKARQDSAENKMIKAALHDGWTPEDLMLALDGLGRSPHNNGVNDKGIPYLSMEYALRDTKTIMRMIQIAGSEITPHNPKQALVESIAAQGVASVYGDDRAITAPPQPQELNQ